MTPDGRHSADLDCQDLVELVTDYLEGMLDEPTRRRFEEHLRSCDGCATYVEQMRETVRAVGRLPADGVSPVMRDRLLAAFRDWRRAPSPP
jgi:anti-sigma factor RsiW